VANLDKYLDFVKDQINLQERLANRYELQPWRQDKHVNTGRQFRELYDDLLKAQQQINEFGQQTESIGNIYRKMALTLEDVEGLPSELVEQLSISESDKLDFAIESILNQAGGILSLDKILIGLYKATGEIHKRNNITSRLYRMRQKGAIYNVPNKSGFYSTRALSEADVRRLFGQEETEVEESIGDRRY
jgi:hypothetical protein